MRVVVVNLGHNHSLPHAFKFMISRNHLRITNEDEELTLNYRSNS